jgi:hypothetical protein
VRIEGFGLRATTLRGWDAEIYRRDAEVAGVSAPAGPNPVDPPGGAAPAGGEPAAGDVVRRPAGQLQGARSETPTPILHLANFPLPPVRGDYGGGAVELMGRGGIFIALLEHDAAEAASALFRHSGIPWPLRERDFDPQQMQRTISGQAGCQRFFTHRDRAFCLYVVIGSYALRSVLVPEVNAALATVELD